MGIEIDYIPVGEGEKSGDAICLRYGNLYGRREEQAIVVIDGGFKKSGEAMVEHIKKYYNDPKKIDFVFLTHPDLDHASGLNEIFDNFEVTYFGMHKAWEHSRNIASAFKDGRVTSNSIKDRLKDDLELVYDLAKKASEKGAKLFEPFSNNSKVNNEITILGPSKEYYEEMLIASDSTPESLSEASTFGFVKKAYESVKNKIQEDWFQEKLFEPADNATKPWNNTSIILLLNYNNRKYLFTGDAGVPALWKATEKGKELGINLQNIDILDVPHHGSKRNLGPKILNYLLGEPLSKVPTEYNNTAYVSASKDGEPKHPSRKVINALLRRGAKVIVNKDITVHHFREAPDRGWGPVTPETFCNEFEE